MRLKQIAEETGDAIAIHYVSLDDLQDSFLGGNSKKHNIPKMIDSIRRYGFRDAITFDPALNEGEGGLLEGNGRLESLIEMRSQGIDPPRGITEDWKVPIAFGVNAKTEAEPIALFNWCCDRYGKDGDFVFDPFLGSGISIVGCEQMEGDRICYGCELSEYYCDVVIARWESLTGEKAVLEKVIS